MKIANTKTIAIILAVALLFFLIYQFGFKPANVGGANLGYAKITGVDSTGKNLIIDATVNLYTNNGAMGLASTNSLTQEQCTRYGWLYDPAKAGIWGGSCGIYSGIDMTKYSYTSNIQCTHSCTRCTLGTIPFTPSFDGAQINYPDMRQFADDFVSCSGTIVVIPKSTTATIPTIPQAHGFSYIINSIIDWINGLFRSIFAPATIQGVTAVQPNTQQTYNIALTAIAPDSVYTDGTYQVQYANWALVDSTGNIIQQGNWEQIYGTYTKSVTLTIPANPGNYVLVGVITQYDMTYNFQTSTWTSSAENVINKEAINLVSKYVVIAPTNPSPGGFTAFILSIVNWFKALFGL